MDALRCALCGWIVLEIDSGSGDGPISPPIVIRARCHNRKTCERPMQTWRLTHHGHVARATLDSPRQAVVASA